MSSIRVKLTTDLTQYGAGLIVGLQGTTCATLQCHSDCFTGVQFDNGARLDVLWKSLEVIDEKALAAEAKYQADLDARAATAHDAVLTTGPRGGFRSLSFDNYTTGYREQADRLLAIMRKHNVPIRTEIRR